MKKFFVACVAVVGLAGVGAGCVTRSEAAGRVEEDLSASRATSTSSALRRNGVACPGAPNGVCGGGEHCCRAPLGGAGVCAAAGAACKDARAKDWGCTGPADCADGQVCCASGRTSTVGSSLVIHRFLGTRCAKTCEPTELGVCEGAAECAGGACVKTQACGMPIGICR